MNADVALGQGLLALGTKNLVHIKVQQQVVPCIVSINEAVFEYPNEALNDQDGVEYEGFVSASASYHTLDVVSFYLLPNESLDVFVYNGYALVKALDDP